VALPQGEYDIDELTGFIIRQCIKIHTRLGPGCLESVYEEVLCYELSRAGCEFRRQLVLPIQYEELTIPRAYKVDLLIENCLVAELKSVFPLPPVFFNQVQTQLVLLDLRYGILLNFKVPRMREGIYRVYNNKGRNSLLI
jgi:GxxExxY protein